MTKLKAHPETPYTEEDIAKAMSQLHKLVLKQSHAYGGKNHKFIPAEVIEGGLLSSIANGTEDLLEAENSLVDEIGRVLDLCERTAQDLDDHLKSKNDKKGSQLVGFLLRRITMAIQAQEKAFKS